MNYLESRINRLKAAVNGDVDRLVQCVRFDDVELISLTRYFLNQCMQHSGANKILDLPNRGSNGRVRCLETDETNASFEDISICCFDLAKEIFGNAIEAIEQPVNIRIYDGEQRGATQDWHSDIWGGEPVDIAILIVPLWGAIDECGLCFAEPQTTAESFAKRYTSNSDALIDNPNYTPYPVALRAGEICVMDSFCLHHSVKGKGVRVSIDFRVKYSKKLPSDLKTDVVYIDKYVKI